jgi:hypothetical protein
MIIRTTNSKNSGFFVMWKVKHFYANLYMQILVVLFLLVISFVKISAQNTSCKSKTTESELIKIAKQKHAYRDKIEKPDVYFSVINCEWEVQSKLTRNAVMKHKMKHTKLTFLMLYKDAEAGKVKSRERDMHYIPYGTP